jgi:hypothetical protein
MDSKPFFSHFSAKCLNMHLNSSVWVLMPPPLSPRPNPYLLTLPESILQDNEKQVKGSRFAKFIAERDKLFRGSTQLGKAGSISNVIFPSKL